MTAMRRKGRDLDASTLLPCQWTAVNDDGNVVTAMVRLKSGLLKK